MHYFNASNWNLNTLSGQGCKVCMLANILALSMKIFKDAKFFLQRKTGYLRSVFTLVKQRCKYSTFPMFLHVSCLLSWTDSETRYISTTNESRYFLYSRKYYFNITYSTHIVIFGLAYVSQAFSQFNNQISVLTCESTIIHNLHPQNVSGSSCMTSCQHKISWVQLVDGNWKLPIYGNRSWFNGVRLLLGFILLSAGINQGPHGRWNCITL